MFPLVRSAKNKRVVLKGLERGEGCWFESRRGAEYFLVVGLFGPSANLAPDRTSSPLNLQQEVEVLKNSTLCSLL